MADAARQMNFAQTNDVPALVVIGQDGNKPPRGSWYSAEDIEAAEAGAVAMGLHAVLVEGADMMALANRTPKGRIFSSGKLFMPRIQKDVYAQLAENLPENQKAPRLQLVTSGDGKTSGEDEGSSSTGNTASDIKGTLPGDWSKIGVGSLVLARDAEEESWFLAVVLGKPSPTTFSLRWRDYPDEPNITRDVSRLAMLHPKTDLSELDWELEE